ncbi:MAG: TatD family hydrolase [Crocinitomicaceae bacterium]|nr:TatD family hydrolase [Crocinitomicaceae bacterium]
MFIDTHTHLFVDAFDEDQAQVVQRAIESGVEKCLLPNIDVDTIDAMHALVEKYPNNCFPMMGLHPGSVGSDWKEKLSIIEKHLFDGNYVAVGEIGMDLHWDKTFVQEQREAFIIQVNWAKKLKLPIVIHAREAFDEIFEVLDELNDDSLTGVFHCFTGTQEQAAKVLSYGGFKLGIGGVLTYKKANIGESLEHVALEHIVLETDSPYLSPVPYRGKRNESAYILHIAEKLADVYGVSLKEIEQQTTLNAENLFNIGT